MFNDILKSIESLLPKDKDGNFITEKEQSDVVHDFLAYLAEQMIDMNKQKRMEVKSYLDWLERETDAEIEELTNRTKLKKYYKLDFEELINILKKNKKKISVNLSDRGFQDLLKKEFDKSLGVISPLLAKIKSTDKLIDQIVYKLYGLNEEEIKIVEDSIK